MPSILPDQRLIFFSKAVKEHRVKWREGISLQADSGRTIDELTRIVAADRWRLAECHRLDAGRLMRLDSPPYRSVISRYYYAMYHAMRSCAFVFHDGDDYEEHSKLFLNIPTDLPTPAAWQTILKDARLLRNRADYDPYPRSLARWRSPAQNIRADAAALVSAAKGYLQTKGCAL